MASLRAVSEIAVMNSALQQTRAGQVAAHANVSFQTIECLPANAAGHGTVCTREPAPSVTILKCLPGAPPTRTDSKRH
ncbi:hypothetical protein MRX96_019582 [Rhipicephalus microplus]